MIGFIGKGLIALLRCLSDNSLRALARALFSRSWREFERISAHPRSAQEKRLFLLLDRSKDTAFGREHDFSNIDSVEEYQQKVPIRQYEEFEPYISRMVQGEQNILIPDAPRFFARSSGTTGAPKYIPITDVYLTEFRRPRRVWMRQVMQAFPSLLRGKILSVHSPRIEGRTPGGTPYGSITTAMSKTKDNADLPVDVFNMEAIPRAVYLVDDFQTKYYLILRFAAQEDLSLIATINPSTTVLLAEKLQEYAPRLIKDLRTGELDCWDDVDAEVAALIRPKLKTCKKRATILENALKENGTVLPTDLWPRLAGLLCWKGGNAPFYLQQLSKLYPGCETMDFGYLASEGGMSLVLGCEGAKGVVAVAGHFLEFVEVDEQGNLVNEKALLCDELELDKLYRVLITGAHGLYRYDINDIVRCVGYYQKTAEIEFVQKGGNMLSVTGEKVGDSHVVRAFTRVTEELKLPMVGFCVSIEFLTTPRYVFGVELSQAVTDERAAEILSAMDTALQAVNIEYAAKRKSLRLEGPRLCMLTSGAFEKERARRVADGAPENHVKPRHLLSDLEALERLGVHRSYEWKSE